MDQLDNKIQSNILSHVFRLLVKIFAEMFIEWQIMIGGRATAP